MTRINKPATENRGGIGEYTHYTGNQPTHEEWLQDIRHMSLASLCEKYDVNEADALHWKEPPTDSPQWWAWRQLMAELEDRGVFPTGAFYGDGIPRTAGGLVYEPFPEVPLARDGEANR